MAQPVQLSDLPFELEFRAGDDPSAELTVTLTADPDPELAMRYVYAEDGEGPD